MSGADDEALKGRFIFDPRFAEAIFHRREGHRVIGKRLLPFSTWHKVQLEYANSPFFAGGEVNVVDLELAVGICGTRYPDFFFYREKNGWRKIAWMIWAERVNARLEARKFEAYLADYLSPPKLWETAKKKGQKPARRDVDDSIAEVAYYLAAYGGSPATAWDLPAGELQWMNVCAAKQSGADVRVWTPADERAFREHVKRREATLEKLAAEFMEKENLTPDEAKKRANTHYWAVVKRNKVRQGF